MLKQSVLKRFDEVLHELEQERQRVDEGLRDALRPGAYVSSAPFLKGGIHKRVAKPPKAEGDRLCPSCYALTPAMATRLRGA